MNLNTVKDDAALVQYDIALQARDAIRGNVKIRNGQILPTSLIWRVLWRFIRPILAVALRRIADTLNEPIETETIINDNI